MASNVIVPAGQAITCQISNGVSGTQFHINYDSTNAPSVIVLPASASTVIAVNTLGVYDAAFPGGNLITTPVAGSTVYVRANVTDPFGSYDITSLGLAVTGPSPATRFHQCSGRGECREQRFRLEDLRISVEHGPDYGRIQHRRDRPRRHGRRDRRRGCQHHHHIPRPRHSKHHNLRHRCEPHAHEQLPGREVRFVSASTRRTVSLTPRSSRPSLPRSPAARAIPKMSRSPRPPRTPVFTSAASTPAPTRAVPPTTALCMLRSARS